MRLIDISGERFGFLILVNYTGSLKHKVALWNCICDCGKEVKIIGTSLRNGKSKSCGCLKTLSARRRPNYHGEKGTPTYNTWRSIIDRCKGINSTKYGSYGGAGIDVCKKWESYDGFKEDMGLRPKDLTIDRLDNSLGYFKENCRWATAEQQARNKTKGTTSFEKAEKIRKMKSQGISRKEIMQQMSLTAGQYGSIIYLGHVSVQIPA